LEERLYKFNATATGIHDGRLLAFSLRSDIAAKWIDGR
jgi:hypothetical protein